MRNIVFILGLVSCVNIVLGSYFPEEKLKGITCKICGARGFSSCDEDTKDFICPETFDGLAVDVCTNSLSRNGTMKKSCASSSYIRDNFVFDGERFPESPQDFNICYKNLRIKLKSNKTEKFRRFCTCVTKPGDNNACNSASSWVNSQFQSVIALIFMMIHASVF